MIMFNKWFTKFLKILQPALVPLLFILAPVISGSHTTSGEIFEKCKSENFPPPTMLKLIRKLAPFHHAYTNIQTHNLQGPSRSSSSHLPNHSLLHPCSCSVLSSRMELPAVSSDPLRMFLSRELGTWYSPCLEGFSLGSSLPSSKSLPWRLCQSPPSPPLAHSIPSPALFSSLDSHCLEFLTSLFSCLVLSCYLKTGFASCYLSSHKTQPSQQLGERRIYYLWQERRTLGIFPKTVSSSTPKLGKVLSWGYMPIEPKLYLIDVTRFRKGQHQHPLGSSWSGGWGFRLIFTNETELRVFTTTKLFLLLFLLLPEMSFVSAFFGSLKIIYYWDLFKDKHCGWK